MPRSTDACLQLRRTTGGAGAGRVCQRQPTGVPASRHRASPRLLLPDHRAATKLTAGSGLPARPPRASLCSLDRHAQEPLIFIHLFFGRICLLTWRLWVSAAVRRLARAPHCGVPRAVARGLWEHGRQEVGLPGSRAQGQWLSLTGWLRPSQTRGQTHVPCVGRQSLIHHTTREGRALYFYLFILKTNIYVFGCAGSYLGQAGPFSRGTRTLSCDRRDLVP